MKTTMTQERISSPVSPFRVESGVLVEGQPLAIAGASHGDEPLGTSGEPTVLIAGQPAAVSDAPSLQDRQSLSGTPTVLISNSPIIL